MAQNSNIIAKILHLSTEMYNNEQVCMFLGRISAETCQKMDYYGRKSPSAGGSAP